MLKLGIIAGLMILAAPAGEARGQCAAPAGVPSTSPAADSVAAQVGPSSGQPTRRLELGASVLPMAFGRIGGGQQALLPSADAALAYGVGVSLSYRIVSGLSVGLAPQVLFNVKYADSPDSSATEYDLMAKVAYAHVVSPRLTVYGELLPGYSVISLPSHLANVEGSSLSNPKGLVLGFGAGTAMEVADKFFVTLGLGYQLGFQSGSVVGNDFDFKTRFLRIALGGGVKL
jgi:hypothetical protein